MDCPTAGDKPRRHQLNLPAIRLHGDKAVLRMRCQILKISQPSEGYTGRGQPFDDILARLPPLEPFHVCQDPFVTMMDRHDGSP